MKVLFTTPILEYPARGGPELRMENTIKALSEVVDLHLIPRVWFDQFGGERALTYYKNLAHNLAFLPGFKKCRPSRLNRYLRYKSPRIFDVLDARHLIRYATQEKFDVVWFGYGNISNTVIHTFKKAMNVKMVCDTDSVWSRFLEREALFAKNEGEQHSLTQQSLAKKMEEKSWIEVCDLTLAVSEVDASYYRSLTEDEHKIEIFSNVIDIKNYEHPVIMPKGFKKPCIFLAGTFGKDTSAMNQAANWVIYEVLPIIQRALPNIHLYIVGKHSDVSFKDLRHPNITVTGSVDSVLPYLKHADVALTPLKYESGTRFKILEAGACKVPMVSTTLGAEGLDVTHLQDILIADKPDEFSNHIVKLVLDKSFAASLAQASYELVKKKYSLNMLKSQANRILEKLT